MSRDNHGRTDAKKGPDGSDRRGLVRGAILVMAVAAAPGWSLRADAGKEERAPVHHPDSGVAADATSVEERGRLARAAFERFKALAGRWNGESTKGWKEETTFRVIAQGSVVMSTSFDAHPNETMATMFYLDGEDLVLTHYCVARNQPRLRATSFEDGGKTIMFTFVDGGNLPSRDRGHMDRAVFRFEGPDAFTTRWTWYQDGQERWMEDIRQTRAAGAR
jgi:hypothetical protein